MPDDMEKCFFNFEYREIRARKCAHSESTLMEEKSPQEIEVETKKEDITQEKTSNKKPYVEKTNTVILLHGKSYAEQDIISVTVHSPVN
jgi:hypothetical protein